MSEVALIALGGAAVFLALCAVLVWWGRRRLRHLSSSWRHQLALVRCRFSPPGPRRDAAFLRLRLDAELRSTRHMLETAPQGLIFRADATAVLAELSATAVDIDRELAAIERFLDYGQQRAALATISPQVKQVIDTAYTARQTILRTAAEDRDRQLAELQARVAAQAAALDIYRKDTGELSA